MPIEFPMRGETRFLTPELRQKAEGSFIRVTDGLTHYQLAGPESGPVVVFVHGFSVPYFVWDPTFEALADAGYRVLRFDLFGRGYSDRPHLRYDLDLFTRQLTELLDELNINQCRAVFGLSMGGVVAANFAVNQLNRLDKLGLFAPAGFPLEIPKVIRLLLLPGVGELVFSLISEKRFEQIVGNSIFDPAEVELVIERYRSQMQIKGFRRAILSTMRAGVAEGGIPVYQRLGKIGDLSVFLLWGEGDSTVPFKYSKLLLSLVPHTRFHPIRGGGHIPHFQQADKVTPLILEFLENG